MLAGELRSYWVCAVRAFVLPLCRLRSNVCSGFSFGGGAAARSNSSVKGNDVVSISISKWVIAFARLGSLTVSWFPCGLFNPQLPNPLGARMPSDADLPAHLGTACAVHLLSFGASFLCCRTSEYPGGSAGGGPASAPRPGAAGCLSPAAAALAHQPRRNPNPCRPLPLARRGEAISQLTTSQLPPYTGERHVGRAGPAGGRQRGSAGAAPCRATALLSGGRQVPGAHHHEGSEGGGGRSGVGGKNELVDK